METPTLHEALLNVINDYMDEEDLSLPEVIGTLEILKHDFIRQSEEEEFDEEDDSDAHDGGRH